MQRSIPSIVLLLLLSGCQTAPADSLTVLFPNTESPAPVILPVAPDDIREPVLLVGRDSLLICTNHMTDKIIRVYNLNNGAMNDILSRGRAEAELLDASSIWLTDDELNVYGANSGKMLRIPLDRIFDPNPPVSVVPFPRGYFSLASCARSDRSVGMSVSSGEAAQTRFDLLGKNGDVQARFGSFPNSGREANGGESALVYQGKLSMNGSGTRAAYASNFGSIFEFFDVSDPRNIRPVQTYCFAFPMCIPDSDPANQRYSVRWAEDCRQGALGVASGEEGCFVLCEEGKFVSDKDWRMSTVYLFDWDGNPLRKFDLGRRVQAIAYDETCNRLIALSADDREAYSFVAYDL